MALVLRAALAQDIDAKIKRLEKMEARIDAKLKKLEAMEARLEVRLQPVAAQSRAGVEPSQDGLKHPSVTLRRATARSSGPAHDEKGLFGGQVSSRVFIVTWIQIPVMSLARVADRTVFWLVGP